MATEARLKANKNWMDANLMRIVIQPRKEEGQMIKDAAKKAGVSTTQFILDAVRKYMEESNRGV